MRLSDLWSDKLLEIKALAKIVAVYVDGFNLYLSVTLTRLLDVE